MKVSGSLYSHTTGNPISGATVDLKLADDDSTLDSTTTNSDGVYTFDLELPPGPVYTTSTVGSTTERRSSHGTMAVDDIDLSALAPWQTIWNNGVNPSYGSALEVTANGSNMVLTVGTGAAIIDGQPFYVGTPQTLTVTTAHATQPRIDLLYLVGYNRNSTDVGKFELVLLAGTPSASPAAPTPTITNGDYISLATIRVDAAVTAIAASGKVTDTRTNSRPATGGITLEKDNVVQGTTSGIDTKFPLYSTYYPSDVADVGVWRGALTPITDASIANGAADISTSTETKLDEIDPATLQPLRLNQSFRCIVRAFVGGEGISGLVDGQIGIKVGSEAIAYAPVQRWEHGVDTTHCIVHKATVTGAGTVPVVELYWKRSGSGTFSPGVYGLDVTFTPNFTAGT